MINIHEMTSSLTQSAANLYGKSAEVLGDLAGHSVKLLQQVSNHVNQDSSSAAVTFLASNVASFTLVHFLANKLSEQFEKYVEQPSTASKIFKAVVIDIGFFAGAVTLSNYALSSLLQLSLNKPVLAAIIIGNLALRYILNRETDFLKLQLELLNREEILLKRERESLDENTDLKKELTSQKEFLSPLKAKLREAQATISSQSAEQQETQSAIDRLTQMVSLAERRIQELREADTANHAAFNDQIRCNKEYKDYTRHLKEENAKLKNRIEEIKIGAEYFLKDFEKYESTKNKEIASANEKITQLEEQLASAAKEMNQLQLELNQLRKKQLTPVKNNENVTPNSHLKNLGSSPVAKTPSREKRTPLGEIDLNTPS